MKVRCTCRELCLVGVQEARWDEGDVHLQRIMRLSAEKRVKNMNW